jgi:hypothetical protein
VKDAHDSRTGVPRPRDIARATTVKSSSYSPGQFFWEAGLVIAASLALGLLVQLLLG